MPRRFGESRPTPFALIWTGCSDDRGSGLLSPELPGPGETEDGLTLFAVPPGYYDSVDLTNSTTLRMTLHDVIDDHTRHP
jgi:hypothetical protein